MSKLAVKWVSTFLVLCCVSSYSSSQIIEERVDSLNRASTSYKFSKPDSSVYLARMALTLAKNQRYDLGVARAYNNIGSVKTAASEYDSAQYFHKEALTISRRIKNANEEAESLNNLGIVKDELGDHQEAIALYLDALNIYERTDNLDGQARMNNNLGIVYKDLEQFDQVIKYYTSALSLYDSLQNQFGVAALSNNLATLHNQLGEYEKAASYAELGKTGFIEAGAPQFVPYSQINLGDAYRELGKFTLAESNLTEARNTLKEFGNLKEQSDAMRSMSRLHEARGEYYKAIEAAKESLRLARQVDSKVYIKNALQRLAESCEKAGDLKAALAYFKEYSIAKDTIFSTERSLQVNRLQTLFETAKKEKVIADQKLSIEQNELELLGKRNQLIAMAFATVFIVLSGILFYQIRIGRQKKQMHEAVLDEKQKGIEAIIQAQDEERKRIAKDLHDGIGQQIGGLKIALQNVESTIPPGATEIKTKIHRLSHIVDDTATDLRTISHEMMPRALAEAGLAPAISDMMEKVFADSPTQYTFHQSNAQQRFSEQVEISLYRIIQELVNNILKHANATHVGVQLMKLAERIILIVEDDGKGFINQDRKGHGIYNITNRASMLGGSATFEVGKLRGIVVTVSIPV